MEKLPFDPYDFFGYVASGLVLVALGQLCFGIPKVFGVDLKPFDMAVTILAVYIAGQVVAGPAKLIFEDVLVHKIIGSPTGTLLSHKKRLLVRIIFPGYCRPLPVYIRDRVHRKLATLSPPPTEAEGIFLAIRYSPDVLSDEALMVKIDKFRDRYGFNRNVSFSLLIASIVLETMKHISGNHILGDYAAIACIVGILLLYRFLKFYRQYSFELLNVYACLDQKGGMDV